MSCLKSVSYSVLLNGQPVGSIKPSKGLRQGDLLSPYLFLLCALGLQSLIQKAEVSDDIKGDRKSTRLNSSHSEISRMPSSA